MSALSTFSAFYYGQTVTVDNRYIDFAESATPRTAVIDVGAYSLSRYLQKVAQAMNNAGVNTYGLSVDRTTRLVTLTSDNPFDLLGTSGPNASRSALPFLGLPVADQLATSSVAGTSPCGFEYITQFPLQSYVPTKNNKRAGNATVTKSASGNKVSVQTFGEERFMKGDFKFITNNNVVDLSRMRANPTGEEDARSFFEYCITKAPIEFMESIADRETFEVFMLESFPGYTDGTGYELKELYDQGLPHFFETGVTVFRSITES